MATITIIIPLYNKERQIERTIRSIQRQTFKDWHLIVVNDGSTDNGPKAVGEIKDARIEIIHQKNAGPGAARNAGIHKANTEYITFIDADDEWHPEFLDTTLKAIRENDVAMVSTTMLELPKKYNTLNILEQHNIEPGIFHFKGNEDPEKIRAIISILHQFTILTRKDTLLKHGGFYTEKNCLFGEDTTLLWRIAFNEKFMILKHAFAYYHLEDSELGSHIKARPLEPYLKNQRTLLDYCPQNKHKLIKRVIDLLVLRRIMNQSRYGLRLQFLLLLLQHPGARRYKDKYMKCLRQLIPGYYLWCKVKKRISYYTFHRRYGGSEDK